MAGLFQVLYGKPDGTFRKAEVLKGTDGEPLIIPVRSKPGKGDDWANGICTRPFAVDWDGDGHLDLVVGTFPGTFYLFKGQGHGKFLPKPEEMKAGDRPLKFEGYHGDPFVIDWDGDGDLDILSGSSEGGVQWAENRAGPGKPPRLEPFRVLIEHGPTTRVRRDPPRFGPQGAAERHADLGRRRQCRREARYPGRRPGAPDLPRRRPQRTGVQKAIGRVDEDAGRGERKASRSIEGRREGAAEGAATHPGPLPAAVAIHEG